MYLLFDIGGTKMRLAASVDGVGLGKPRIVATPRSFEDGVALFARLAGELADGQEIFAAAGGVASPLDRKKSIPFASNMPDWDGKPLKQALQRAVEAPVYLENNAALAGLGEAAVGAGKWKSIVAYMTVGTGVGGARIVDGVIDANVHGFEPGNQIIDPHGGVDISGRGVEQRYGKRASDITDPGVWEELARWFAYLLNNTIVHWSPDVVVLGGSMVVKKPGIPIERVRFHLKDVLKIFPEPPPLKKAMLGDIGGLHGALVFLRQQMPSR